MLNVNDTDRVLDNAFSLEFLQGKLTQKRSEAPIVYKGSGNIAQTSDGSLVLKLYHLYESSDELMRDANTSFYGSEPQLGKIIEDDYYFDFEGIDLSGYRWTSPRLGISGNVSFPSNGKIITAPLESIETRWATQTIRPHEIVKAQLYIPGKFRLPLSVCELRIAGRSCVLEQHDSHLEIIAELPDAPNPDEHLNLILEGLSIAIGRDIRPRLKKVSGVEQQIQVIYSRVKDKRQLELPPPIPISHSRNAANLQAFLDKFIETINERHSPLVGYWFRVLQAFSGDVENSALVLTTAIEGLLKDYYSDFGAPDQEFLKQLSDAKPLIKNLPVEIERAKNCLLNMLGNAKRTSAKSSLRALAETKLIPEDMVELWTTLRNKSAHPRELKFDSHQLQVFVDQLHGCLELFYRLILGKIGYSDQIVQYSIPEWPETNLSAVRLT